MTPTEIPQEIKDQIEAEAKKYGERRSSSHDVWAFTNGAEFGYRLALDQAPYIFGPERTKKGQ